MSHLSKVYHGEEEELGSDCMVMTMGDDDLAIIAIFQQKLKKDNICRPYC